MAYKEIVRGLGNANGGIGVAYVEISWFIALNSLWSNSIPYLLVGWGVLGICQIDGMHTC